MWLLNCHWRCCSLHDCMDSAGTPRLRGRCYHHAYGHGCPWDEHTCRRSEEWAPEIADQQNLFSRRGLDLISLISEACFEGDVWVTDVRKLRSLLEGWIRVQFSSASVSRPRRTFRRDHVFGLGPVALSTSPRVAWQPCPERLVRFRRPFLIAPEARCLCSQPWRA